MLNLSDQSELITLDTLASKDQGQQCQWLFGSEQSNALTSGAWLGPRPAVAWRVGGTRDHEVPPWLFGGFL